MMKGDLINLYNEYFYLHLFILCRLQDYMPPPPKKPCVMDNVQTFSTKDPTARQLDINEFFSKDILKHHANILQLFQCFHEAENNQLCKALLQATYKERQINLENHVLLSHHLAALGMFLSKPNYKWKTLNLANCSINNETICQLYQYFSGRTAKKSVVDEINLSNNFLFFFELSFLTHVLSHLRPSILHLSDNPVTLKYVASVLTTVTTIKELHVEKILIIGLDREVVFNMMSSLSLLSIGRNELGDKGVEVLSEGLLNSTSLLLLGISHNKITCKGAKTLSLALLKNTSLLGLDLSSNSIGDDGAIAIADALAHGNTKLVVLSVERNNIGRSGMKRLKSVAASKTPPIKLTSLLDYLTDDQ